MSRLESGGVYSRSSRTGGGDLPRTRIGNLEAPGVLPLPPDFSDTHALNDFAQIFGMTADLAMAVKREQDATKARNEREQDQIDSVLRGAGASQADLEYPKMAAGIENGTIPIGDEPSDQIAASMLDQATQGMPAPKAHGYRRMGGRLAAQIEAFKARGQAAGKELTLKEHNSDAVSARTPEELAAAYNAARITTRGDDLRAQEITYLSALRAAAESGDQQRFDMVKGVMGEKVFAQEIARASGVLETARGARSRAASQAVDDRLGAMMYSDAPIQSMRDMLNANTGMVGGEKAQQLREKIDAEEQRRFKAMDDTYETEAKARVVDQASGLLDAGGENGGSPFMQDVPIKLPSGKEIAFKAKDIVDAAREQKWAAIGKLTSEPDQQRALKAEWLSKNPGAEDPTLKALWTDVASRVRVDTTEATLDPAAVAAVDEHRKWRALNPSLVARHTTPKDEAFLRVVETASRFKGYTTQKALLMAGQRANTDPAFSQTISRDLHKEDSFNKITNELGADSKNLTDVSGTLEEQTRAYMAVVGLSEADAITASLEDFKADYRKLGGYWVYTRNSPVRERVDLDKINQVVTAQHAATHEYDKGSLVIVPNNRGGGGWQVWLNNLGPTDESPTLSDTDVLAIQQELDRSRSNEKLTSAEKGFAANKVKQGFAASQFGPGKAIGVLPDIFLPSSIREKMRAASSTVKPQPEVPIGDIRKYAPGAVPFIEYMRSQSKTPAQAPDTRTPTEKALDRYGDQKGFGG